MKWFYVDFFSFFGSIAKIARNISGNITLALGHQLKKHYMPMKLLHLYMCYKNFTNIHLKLTLYDPAQVFNLVQMTFVLDELIQFLCPTLIILTNSKFGIVWIC